jgi:amino acid transporter
MRYAFLIVLNLPVILIAIINLFTRYKLGRISKRRFRIQISSWLIILAVLIGSFPVYNILSSRPTLTSNSLGVLDIIQTTAIILLFYVANNQRQKVEWNERMLRDLHQELSIKLSGVDNAKASKH